MHHQVLTLGGVPGGLGWYAGLWRPRWRPFAAECLHPRAAANQPRRSVFADGKQDHEPPGTKPIHAPKHSWGINFAVIHVGPVFTLA